MNPMSENPGPSKTISITLVDDHQVLTDALTAILRSEPDLQVVDVAGTCAAARASLARTCPNVLLLDVSLPDGDGLSLVPEFNRVCPSTSILVLTSFSDEKTLVRAIETGVNGFVSKERSLSEVITAIRQAAEDEIVMPATLLIGVLRRSLRAHSKHPAQTSRGLLTPREQEILVYLARGKSVPDIAAELSIAPLTVRTHINNLMQKLDVHSRLEAVSHALRHRLIDLPV
jgi:two-component system nitrate/nitrite response regulator NarL